MAWNGSDGYNAAKTADERRSVKPTWQKGVLAGVIVVAAAGVAFWFSLSTATSKTNVKKAPEPTKIAETEPAKPAQLVKSAQPDEDPSIIKPSGKKHTPKQLTVDRKSAVATPNIASNSLVITYGSVNGKSFFKRRIFRHNSENLIAGVLTTPPGIRILEFELGKRFEEDFVQSLVDPIRVEEGDTPEEIELKQLMVDVKKDLANRIKDGENLIDIIKEARKDINKLAQYNDDVRRAYYELRNTSQDPDEVEDFRIAANKMLEERGLPPIGTGKKVKSTDAPSPDENQDDVSEGEKKGEL